MSEPETYRQLVERLRQAFPAPTSDPVHDGYVVFSLLRALDQVDALKSQAPILGTPRDPDFMAAQQAVIGETGQTLEAVIPQLVACLQGMLIWGHPRSQVNVVAHPSIASLVGTLLPTMYNPNLCSEESSRGFSEAEVRVASMVARLLGYEPEHGAGVFTFGGTGTLLYGIKLGLERAIPGIMQRGLVGHAGPAPCILASDQRHYAVANVAAWLGIGNENVIAIPSRDDNSMDVDAFARTLREQINSGRPIAAIIATMGTTDAFGLDDLGTIIDVRDRVAAEAKLPRPPHVHADAVIGWAWSVFRDYDFAANPLGFRGRTLRALAGASKSLKHLARADSVGIDFHKTGFAPYISSLVWVRDRADFSPLSRDRATMPYIYHSGEHHPGMFTLETSRGGQGPMTALANLLLLGKQGFRALIGHQVDMAERLRELIAARPELTVVNDQNLGPVTLFRAYPDGIETFGVAQRELHDAAMGDEIARVNDLNRRIYQQVHALALLGHGVAIGFTECYRTTASGMPLCALKSYVNSPFVDEARMESIVEHVLAARGRILAENSPA